MLSRDPKPIPREWHDTCTRPADIRGLALGAVRRVDQLLVFEAEDPETGEPVYRLLGGVEFGEHSREALIREFDEELGVDLHDPELVGTFEQLFTLDGESVHGVWRVYEADVVEDWPYEPETFAFEEPETGKAPRAVDADRRTARRGDHVPRAGSPRRAGATVATLSRRRS